jgi:hypothetical protein
MPDLERGENVDLALQPFPADHHCLIELFSAVNIADSQADLPDVAEIKEHIRLPECGNDTVLADLADVIWVANRCGSKFPLDDTPCSWRLVGVDIRRGRAQV